MDPLTPCVGENLQKPFKSNNDDAISSCRRQFSRPAHYGEEHREAIGSKFESLRRPRIPRKYNATLPITPPMHSPRVTSTMPHVPLECIATSSDYIPLSPQSYPFFTSPVQQSFPEPSPIGHSATDKPCQSFTYITKSNISNNHYSDSSPIGKVSNNITGSRCISNIENTTSSSIGSSKPSMPSQPRESNEANDSSEGTISGIKYTPTKPMPSVPRIIIPDGTSINLSTPPTTPRQPYKAPLPSIVSNQPYNFQQIMEKLRSQGLLANRKNQVLHFCRAIGSKKSVIDNQQQESHQSLDGTVSTAGQVELTELNAAEGQEASSDMNKNHSDPSSLEEDHQPHYMSELGVIGFQMGGRNISVLSSEKYIWWDYEESTEGLFSKERWRRVLCSRPGLSNIFKYLITTSLGLITILAISLTALGKIKNYQQVSDNIPTSLANSVMEAQIVVIKDFNRFQQSNLAKDRYVQLEDQSQLKTSPKVPVWTRPIRQGCFHEKCDIEDLGKEYFAFMHPESFGISLPNNWPSLCNSCIEISRNQFVYRTKVRILGDLTTCTDDLTQVRGSVDSNTPAFTSQSIPIPRPTAMPLDQKFHRRKYKLSESHSNEYTPRSSKSIEKNQGLGASVSSDPLTQVLATARLPYLIVDPSTFNNLTMYDTQASLLLMDLLQVQFRFVLCDI